MPAMPLGDYQLTEEVRIKGSDCTTIEYIKATGLTKQEHFAGLAMQALIIANNGDSSVINGIGNSLDAIACADLLLQALEKVNAPS